MEGLLVFAPYTLTVKKVDGTSVTGEEMVLDILEERRDARKMALKILEFLGPSDIPENAVAILWDSANNANKCAVIRDLPPAVQMDYRDPVAYHFYRDLPQPCKAHVKQYYQKVYGGSNGPVNQGSTKSNPEFAG